MPAISDTPLPSRPGSVYASQATWSIDESNVTGVASDANSGVDDAHPLLSIDEFVRRACTSGRTGTTIVRWLSNTTHSRVNLFQATTGSTALPIPDAPAIIFQGVPTVLRTGTLTGATSTPWTVSDSSLPTSWSASGLVSTTSGTRLIRTADRTKHAFIGYENVAKTAQTSPANGYLSPATTWQPMGTPSAAFVNGDAYEVLSLPKFPTVTPPDYGATHGATVFSYLDMDAILGGQVEIRNCGFPTSFPSLNAATRSGNHQFHGAIFMQGISLTSSFFSNTIDRAMFLGNAAIGSYNGDWNGQVNVVAKGAWLQMNHASLPRLGTIYVYDCTANPAIQVTNNSQCTLDALHGSGNTGVLIDVRDPGCSFNSRSAIAAFDATTSAATPITIVGVGKNYVDLPFWSTNQNAGFAIP